METLFPEQQLSHNHQTTADMSTPPSQPAPENAAAVSKPHLLYKCLLNQHAQKLKNSPPIYQTQNEGSDHSPRFRSTVWLDGASYTSTTTFQQRKMAEMDASKVAYIALTQKAKIEALNFIREDKIFCKAIMSEFAAKKNIRRPIYETIQLEGSVPFFRSNLNFNGVTYTGINGKNKKEAEQLVARSVIIKFLDSEEAGNDMAIIVNCKLRQYQEMNKVQEIHGVQNASNVLLTQTGVEHELTLTDAGTSSTVNPSAPLESSLGQTTTSVPATCLSQGTSQPIIPQLSVDPITPVAPIVIQPPTPQVSIAHVEPETSSTQAPVEPIKPAAEPMVLTMVQSSVVVSEPLVQIPATDISSNVTQQPKPEASLDQTLEYIPLVGETSNKKRNRKNKKNARKKRLADAQMPVVPASQVLS